MTIAAAAKTSAVRRDDVLAEEWTMTSDETIFAEAVRIGSSEARAAFLDQACSDNSDLRRQVESLLQAHEQAGGFLEPLNGQASRSGLTMGLQGLAEFPSFTADLNAAPAEVLGTNVGPYKLLERLGDGGMGVVYMAEQLYPVRRRVALKIIKPGMDSGQVIARFEAERQALALMDHPSIARVLDVGTTEAGRPYFAMELVRGVSICQYCDTHQLSTRERLALFVQVCHAVQHAHNKGVIHRDLKPSNLMVTLHDGVPVPKVIDFGIAKAINQRLTDRTLFTQYAQLIGTPLYMSPEQAEFSGLDVDTRSDVYSLGVMLYELLTGTTPFDRKRLGTAALDEVRRIIREEDPPRPSTRLSTLAGEMLSGVVLHRRTDSKKLRQLMRGELDWIAMRCLEKDRTRRYETANALARDVQRYLADEPVEACPPSPRYRVGKFLRRHRGPVLAASLLLIALIGGVCGTTWGLVQAQRGRTDAETARANESGQRLLAEANALKARQRLAQIEKVDNILYTIFSDLDPNPEVRHEGSLRVVLGQRLDRLTAQLKDEAVGDAVTVAKLQNVLGCSQRHLGYPNKAIPLLESARQTFIKELGAGDRLAIEATNNLAVSYLHAGRTLDAVPLLQESVKAHTSRFGADHPDALVYLGNLGDAYTSIGRLNVAVPLLEETLENLRAKQGPDHLHSLSVLMNLARAYQLDGRGADARRCGQEALKRLDETFGADHRLTLVSMGRLADTYWALHDRAAAMRLYHDCYTGLKKVLGPDTPETFLAASNLGWAYRESGQPGEAIALFELALAGQEREFGSDHQETLRTRAKLGLAYQDIDKLDKAIWHLKQAMEIGKVARGAEHPETLVAMNNLACAYRATDQLENAIALFEQALEGEEKVLGPHDQHTLACTLNLINAYRDAKRPEAAVPLIKRLIRAYEALGNHAEAEKWRNELLPLMAENDAAAPTGPAAPVARGR
ncbi:MAG: serine/threonine-protein kinase [Chloroflexota bacterium]|nr:serine/threonine-protein kinase [Chloroflexota bacterium]